MNETKLVNLSGTRQAINPAITKIPIQDLDDFSAGIVFAKMVTQLYPDITWGELYAMKKKKQMSGMWDSFTGFVGDIYDGGKTLIGDVVEGTGDVFGSAVRLAADDQVAGTVGRAGAAYATGGFSEGLMGLFGGLGTSAKQQAQKNPIVFWGALGAAGLVIVMLAMKD